MFGLECERLIVYVVSAESDDLGDACENRAVIKNQVRCLSFF